jgi:hypothetical protein
MGPDMINEDRYEVTAMPDEGADLIAIRGLDHHH